jgi:hypothetical protein
LTTRTFAFRFIYFLLFFFFFSTVLQLREKSIPIHPRYWKLEVEMFLKLVVKCIVWLWEITTSSKRKVVWFLSFFFFFRV